MKKGKLKIAKHSVRILERNREIKEKYEIKLMAGFKESVAKKQLATEFFLSYDSIHSILYREE